MPLRKLFKNDSFVPNHVKKNFVHNYVRNVAEKCSNEEIKNAAHKKVTNRLAKNGFFKVPSPNFAGRQMKDKKEKEKATLFQIDFISDSCNRKINKIIKNYDFKINLVSKPAKYLKHCLGTGQNSKKHDNCEICQKLPENFKCDDRFLVYKFTCEICGQFYIGETCRPFKLRFAEHMRSLRSKNKVSALAEHAYNFHNGNMTMQNFHLDIVKKCVNPLETRLSEATAIDRFRPPLNRRHENI